jgi:ABC-type dipeptide/oligopeptide/nickel transport system permease subunit
VAQPGQTATLGPETWLAGRRIRVVRKLLGRRTAAVALAALTVVILSAVLASLFTADPNAIDPVNQLQGPSLEHPFGTDELGRDLFSRILRGGRIALAIVGTATAIAVALGVIWGGVAAARGGLLDEVLMRTVDGFMAIPLLLFGLIFVAAFGANATSLAVIIGLLHAPPTARIARAAALSELTSDYCLAAKAYGASHTRVLFSEVLPNALPTLLVQATLVAANSLVVEATLSFVGLGVQPPAASWGTLLLQGYGRIYSSYWYVIFPGLMIFVTIWALNTVADNLQAVLDPRAGR